MKICDINKLKNKDYIVLLPKDDYDIKDSVDYSFENVFFIDYEPTKEDETTLINFINTIGKQLVLFDYCEFYRKILPYIKKQKTIKWILKNSFATLTDGNSRATFKNMIEFYDREIIDQIGCLDRATYEVLKNAGYKVKHITLDVKQNTKKPKSSNSIGIIGDDYNPNHNIYNELTALKMVDYSYIKIIKQMNATKHFIGFFDIKEKEVSTLDEVINDNFVNLYCNFTFTNKEYILKSMDNGVPCLIGNTDIFDKYPKLKDLLVLKSDDDVNEIASKITGVKNNLKIIMNEYTRFRNDYTKKSKKSIEEFIK